MRTKLDVVVERARKDREVRFTSLAHLLTPAFLKETWGMLNKKGAAGIDGETVKSFGERIDERIADLLERVRKGQYRAPAVRRVEIPKDNGKVRAIGIPTVEDRLLQAAVARLLGAVFEPLFLDCSFGYRPGRSAHDALRTLRSHLIAGQVMHVYETDLRSYFDTVNHEWLRRMLRERVRDPVVLRLIDKWLRAGAMAHGLRYRSEEGVPQGGPVSCILSNIYLHYALDLWFERVVKSKLKGKAHLVRYVDDFVVCYQYQADAKRCGEVLEKRFGKFGIKQAPEKTRMLLFGRFARERLNRTPETFEFLGFRHVCGTDRNGRYSVVRLPSTRSCRRFRQRVKSWLEAHMHWKVRDQQRRLNQMLQGFYRYFALPHCGGKLYRLYNDVMRMWRQTLKRRSQRSKTHWSYLLKQPWFVLDTPVSLHRGT